MFKLKDDKIEPPDIYLGAQLDKMIVDGIECWTMSAERYVSASENVEEALACKQGTMFTDQVLHSFAVGLLTRVGNKSRA